MGEQLGASFLARGATGLNSVGYMNQKIALVQRFPLFAGISSGDCANVVSAAHERHFLRRQTIFLEGDPIRQILLLLSGCVKVTQFGQTGSEVILRLNGPGEIVGAMGLRAGGDHCSTGQALEACSCLSWEAASFEALSERYPTLRRNIVSILEQRLQEMDQRFREISTEKVAPRLSSQLVRLLNQVGKRVNGYVEISLSREELAQLTGTTLFTVSRLLCQWEVLGIVGARREAVQVRDLPALIALSQEE